LTRVELIPGKSALWWSDAAVRLLLSAIGLTLCLAVLIGTREIASPNLSATLVPLVGVLMAVVWPVALTANGLAYSRKFREYRSGYTTLLGEGHDYPQVEPTSGWVIRAAGEPGLSRSRWKAACARVIADRQRSSE
jgi:hypothetical protein